jgi:hypothetical protein
MKITNKLPIIMLFLALAKPIKASEGGNNKRIILMGKQPVYVAENDEKGQAGQPPIPKEPLMRATPKDPNDGHDNIWDPLGEMDGPFEDAMFKAFFAIIDGGEKVGQMVGLLTKKKEGEGEDEQKN